MSKLEEIAKRRLEVGREAAQRWKEREKVREVIEEKGARAVEDPEDIARYEKRALKHRRQVINPRPIPDGLALERVIGPDDRHDIPKVEEERIAGRPVARIVTLPRRGREPAGFGTGFMVSPNLLLTNHHVLPNAADAATSGANFGHEFVSRGNINPGEIFNLEPRTFFINDRKLDFALVAVAQKSGNNKKLSDFGMHPLIAETGKTLIGQQINIIQHPKGLHKRYATDDTDLVDRLDLHLHYKSDTDPGSSGSPCFNEFWQVVALHHSSVPLMDGDKFITTDGDPLKRGEGSEAIAWIANEGVRISKILEHLRNMDKEELTGGSMLDELLGISDSGEGDVADDRPVPDTSIAAETVNRGVFENDWGDARTIVHVHGAATVNTGDGNPAPPVAVSANQSESLETLQISAQERSLRFDPDYARRAGYCEHFLRGLQVGLPQVNNNRIGELFSDRHGNPVVLDYHHFSLVMNEEWKMVMWAASNVDYSSAVRFSRNRLSFGSDSWMLDPRVPDTMQIDDDELYAPARKFDRGHVVGRNDNVWGTTLQEAEFANSDTFHWTNCTPQHEEFNQHGFGRKGLWGGLERHIAKQAKSEGSRVILYAGPVLKEDRMIEHDFGNGLYRVPLDFWKVVVVSTAQGQRSPKLKAYGFLMEQESAIDDHGLEAAAEFAVGKYAANQRPLKTLSALIEVTFPEEVMKADMLKDADDSSGIPLESLDDVNI